MAHSRGFRARTTPRRATAWDQGPQEVDRVHSASEVKIWSSTVVPAISGLTVIRVRGYITATLLTAAAAGDGFFGAFGLAIVTTAAATAGVSAVPTPITEDDWDGWFWHQYFDVRATTATIADGVNAAGARFAKDIDSKAMRKFPDEMTMIGVSEVIESGAASVEVQSQTRVLVKLP